MIEEEYGDLTFWEQASLAIIHMFPQVPAIPKVIVALNELNPLAFG